MVPLKKNGPGFILLIVQLPARSVRHFDIIMNLYAVQNHGDTLPIMVASAVCHSPPGLVTNWSGALKL